jgi:hypothetical protein
MTCLNAYLPRLSPVCTGGGQSDSDKIAVRWESQSSCRISATLSCAATLPLTWSTHLVGDREWRVSIAGSRAAEDWNLRVEGPNGFERSYTLSAAAGEHELSAIRTLILRLVPPAEQ